VQALPIEFPHQRQGDQGLSRRHTPNAQACFITTTGYAKRSWEEANREGFKRIGLVNGRRLVEILADKYPELPDELQERLRLRRVLIPE